MGRLLIAFIVAGFLFLGGTGVASAHGFGERYDLPVPLFLYLYGAGATVALSFVVIALFVRRIPSRSGYPRYNLLRHRWLGRALQSRLLLVPLKLVSLALFLLVILTGLWGNQNPNLNLAPTFVWVIWWVGFGFTVALVGNLWPLINPWKVVYDGVERVFRWVTGEGQLSMDYPYPSAVGVWPALGLFFVFAWVENVYVDSAVPFSLAVLVIGYSIITWTGMLVFGKYQWLRHGEAFSVLYGLLGRFAPTEVRVPERRHHPLCRGPCRLQQGECVNCYECFQKAAPSTRQINLRPLAVGLALDEEVSWDRVLFVIFTLAFVTFDGFEATPKWVDVLVFADPLFHDLGGLTAISTLGLMAFPAIFLGAYLAFSFFMAWFAGERPRFGPMARGFAYSLIPIALAYNIAHFFSFLVIQGQGIIPLASDPFGYGWDLLGTADYRINIAIVNARFAWFLSVAAIVLGHIIAVYLAHRVALRLVGDHRTALRSQYPMLTLMVSYTITSLWIIAQPIVVEP